MPSKSQIDRNQLFLRINLFALFLDVLRKQRVLLALLQLKLDSVPSLLANNRLLGFSQKPDGIRVVILAFNLDFPAVLRCSIVENCHYVCTHCAATAADFADTRIGQPCESTPIKSPGKTFSQPRFGT